MGVRALCHLPAMGQRTTLMPRALLQSYNEGIGRGWGFSNCALRKLGSPQKHLGRHKGWGADNGKSGRNAHGMWRGGIPRVAAVLRRKGDYKPHSQGQAPQPACLGSNTLAVHDISTLDMAPRPCYGPGNVLIPLHACVAGSNLTWSIIQVGKK